MDSRDVFFELLNKTQISNVEDAEQAQAKLVRMQEWLLNNVPHKLYRFRSSNTNNFTALKEDSIWGSRIDTFNDPFECVPCYDAQKCDELLGRTPDIQFVQSIIEQLAQGDDSRTQNIVKTIVPPDYVNILRINAKQIKVNKATYNALKIFQANIHTELAKHFPDLLRDFFAGMKYAQQYVACFTEERDATLMWGHYAEGHKGFCVEYDFAADLKRCTKPCKDIRGCRNFMLNWALAPVQYSDKRFDATSYLMTVMQDYIDKKVGMPLNPFFEDTLVPTKCLLWKSNDWSYEKEWRLLSVPDQHMAERHKNMGKLKPTAVYIGACMESENENLLRCICKDKGIPCYKMAQMFTEQGFELKPYLIDSK